MVARQAESDYVALRYPWTTIPKGDCSRADKAKGAITIKSLIKGEIWKSFLGLGLQSLWHFRRETYSRWKRWLEMASNPSCAKIHAQKKKKSATLSLCSEQNTSVCEIAVAMTTRGCSPLTRVPKENKSWCLWMRIQHCLRERGSPACV